MQSLISAIRTLSILPVPGRDAASMAEALPWFPLVGAILGWLLWGLSWGYGLLFGDWPQSGAFLVLLGGVLLTRGFHLDGLADCADGLGGGNNREARLAIMKDSHMGVFGGAAIILLLLGKWICLTRLAMTNELLWLPTAYIVSRTMTVALTTALPYAREDGTGASFVRGSSIWHLIGAFILATLLLYLSGRPYHLLAWLPAGIFTLLWGAYSLKRLGGVTGDVLGAAIEITEALILFYGCLL